MAKLRADDSQAHYSVARTDWTERRLDSSPDMKWLLGWLAKPYSVLSATVGSILRARRVGTTQASMHTPNISAA